MSAKRDGQPLGPKQTITAEEQRRRLGIDRTAEPQPAPLPLTPAQARRQMAGEWVGDDLAPPDYEASVVSDPDAVAQVLGLRPDDFDSAPLGSQPEGMPIPQPGIRPKVEHEPYEPLKAPPPSPADDAAAKAELAANFRAHAAKVAEIAASAKNGIFSTSRR